MSELYQLPDGWEWKKLNDFVEIKGGKRLPNGQKLVEYKTPYPYIRVSDFNEFGSINLNSLQYITEGIYSEIKNYIISKHDIYISIAGTIGKTGIIPEELDGANLTENAARLIFDNNNFDKSYLLLFTKSRHFLDQVGLATKVVAMPKLALTRLKNVFVPLPLLTEQKRIVQKLDELFERIDKAIALLQKNIDAADNFMNSVLNDVFSHLEQNYPVIKLSDIAYIKGGKRLPKGEKLSETKTRYPYIRVADFLDAGTVSLEKMLYITEEVHKQIKNYIITSNDLYISIAGTIGKTGIIPDILNGANLTENAARLVYKDSNVLNRYIYFLTNSTKFKEQIGLATKTVAQPKLALSRLSEVELPLPTLDTQSTVVIYLDRLSIQVEQLKSAQQKKLQSLLDLKSSILDQAFHGKL